MHTTAAMNPKRDMRAPAALLSTLLLPAAAWAHPGHADAAFSTGLMHPFLGLDHLLAAVAVGAWAARIGGRALWAIPMAFLVAMLTGAAIGTVVPGLPAAEALIAVSVLLLGVALACDARASVPLAVAVVALLAPFHGAAHATAAPAMASAGVYVAALLLGTAALHALGVAAAVALRAHPLVLRVAAAPVMLAGLAMLWARAL